MKIAVEGCAHGELEKIYDAIQHLEKQENTKVDLLICCGDFQSTRNISDLRCMACPIKYQNICTFYKYYSGEKTAPILTIFIGGNHEASNYLQELPYGGWVAPNIYYLGYAGVINIAGVRIGGISGIYKGHDFLRGHFEKSPYTEDTKRSVYHIRNLEVFRLKQVSGHVDIFLSHDWPRGVYHYGNVDELIKIKPFFKDEIFENKLGSKPCEDLLDHLRPTYWFAAHLHCKFAGLVPHRENNEVKQTTKFLALDKCLPRRKFLQIVEIEHDSTKNIELSYDLQWLTILYLTNHLLSIKQGYGYMPDKNSQHERFILKKSKNFQFSLGLGKQKLSYMDQVVGDVELSSYGKTKTLAQDTGRSDFTPTDDEKQLTLKKFNNDFVIPKNFLRTVDPYDPTKPSHNAGMPPAQTNQQTEQFAEKLGVDDPLHLILINTRTSADQSMNTTLPSYLTPERNSNRTFCDSAVLNDSDLDVTKTPMNRSSPWSVERTPGKRFNLPAPKDSPLEDVHAKDENLPLEGVGQSDNLFIVDNGGKEDNKALFKSNETPQPLKKFKRRNADMYRINEDI